MGIYDSLKPFASQYPNRTENFIQEIKFNSETGLYETTFSPHAGYNDATGKNYSGNYTTTYNGCPEGQVMGPDGVCRVDPNYTGQPTSDPTTPETPTDPTVPVVPDMGQGQGGGGGSEGGGSNYYDDQQAFYRSISASGATSSTGQIDPNRKDKYKTLPGGMKNWSDSQLYQWALDNNYFTSPDRMNMKTPPPGSDRYAEYNKDVESYFNKTLTGQLIGKVSEFFSKKGFDDWLSIAQDRGLIKREGKGWKILKGPGDNPDSLYAGGYLVPLDEQKQVDANYAQGYFSPVEAPTGKGTIKQTSTLYNDLSKQSENWWQDTFMTWLNDGYFVDDPYSDDDTTGKQPWPMELQSLADDDLIQGPGYFGLYPGQAYSGGELDDRFKMGGEFHNLFKQHVLDEANIYDAENTKIIELGGLSQKDRFDLAHPNYDQVTSMLQADGKSQVEADKLYWLSQAGIDKADYDKYRLTSAGPHVEEPGIVTMEGTLYSPSIDLSVPVASSNMNYNQLTSVYGDNINEVTKLVGKIGSKVQKTDIVVSSNDGSPGNKNQDGTTADWGYNADGQFVNTKTGQTAAMGSMADAVSAINSGNASTKLLERFAWEHKDNTTGYNSMEEYMAAKDNKVTYRNKDGDQTTVNSGNYDKSDDNSKGTKIICDYFYRKGLLSEKLWKADEAYGAELMVSEPDVMKGYHAWAEHYVREMEKESTLGKVYFAWAKLWVPHWAKYLAGEKTIRGKILHSIGKPICNMIGKFNRRLKWQQA
jgi:hypothetical protein